MSDQEAPRVPLRHAARFGWPLPPLAGADGEEDTKDTPTTADTPEEGTGTTEQTIPDGYVPEDRYKEAQAWGTRLAQEKADLEQAADQARWWQLLATSADPDTRQQAAQALGVELAAEADADEQPEYLTREEWSAYQAEQQQAKQQQTQTQQEEEQYASYRETVAPQLTEMGVPDGLQALVADMAWNQLPAVQTPQGPQPDLQEAYKRVEEFVLQAAEMPSVQGKLLEKYRGSKRAPHISPVGQAGTSVPNLDDRNERLEWYAERLAADQ